MNETQLQCLLLLLGFYPGPIDGIWGTQSRKALERFREACSAAPEELLAQLRASISDEEPGDWWQEIRFFQEEEFACKCGRHCDGYPARMDENLVRSADAVREHFGKPALVSSGLRCANHNAAVGGVANSRHLTGKAMDFCIPGVSAAALLSHVQQLPRIRYAYAIDGSYVHMDVE